MRLLTGTGFRVLGIAKRTSNSQEMSGEGPIPRLWDQVRRTNPFEHLTGRADTNVLALYTGYENGADGEYTFMIGVKTSERAEGPNGLVVHDVPGGDYLVFTSERGPVHEVVPALWGRIWSEPALQPGAPYQRTFATDFELYDHRAANPTDAQVDIYIGVAIMGEPEGSSIA